MRRLALSLAVLWLVSLAAPALADAVLRGDPARGASLWGRCKSCHQVGQGALNMAGPHLNDVFDRAAGSVEGYRYSADMVRAGADGLVWTWEKLDVYVTNPQSLVTNTRMKFRGLADPQDRADVLAYLRAFSASPQNIPEAAPTTAATDPDVAPEILAIEGDRDYGEYLSSECVTCHQADGADRGIPSITGWPADIFVVVMHAYKRKARVHPVMQMMAGRLSDEEIAALAAYFEGVE